MFNNYFNGTDTLGVPDRRRFQTDDSFLLRYYNHPEKTGISQMAMSFTTDWGCEYGGGVVCTGGDANTPSQQFAGWMAYNHIWFHNNRFAITPGGGVMTNPGRYLTLLPPINGADAITGSPYFPEGPGLQAHQWDATLNFQYYPAEFITFWGKSGIATRTCRISRAEAASRRPAGTTDRPSISRATPARPLAQPTSWPRRRPAAAGPAASGSPISGRPKPYCRWASW